MKRFQTRRFGVDVWWQWNWFFGWFLPVDGLWTMVCIPMLLVEIVCLPLSVLKAIKLNWWKYPVHTRFR